MTMPTANAAITKFRARAGSDDSSNLLLYNKLGSLSVLILVNIAAAIQRRVKTRRF